MVERFLTGDEVQHFNPISEAKDVLIVNGQLSGQDDRMADDITLVGGFNLNNLKENQSGPVHQPTESSSTHRAAPQASTAPAEEGAKPSSETKATLSIVKVAPGPSVKKKEKIEPEVKAPVKAARIKKTLKKQSYLQYLVFLGFLTLAAIVYYRKIIIRHFFFNNNGFPTSSFSIFPEVHAQDAAPEKKKSS